MLYESGNQNYQDMPIYMDRHDVSDNVTAENVAQIHQKDLKVQHKFGCRGLTYWFDDVRKTAFCLVEAPNKEAIIKMHHLAHGEIPHQVIEVEANIVESFLGRIEDPEKALKINLNIINDPAFRIIMAVSVVSHSFKNNGLVSFISKIRSVYRQMKVILEYYEGSVVRQTDNGILISFQSVTKAVLCAQKIHQNYTAFKSEYQFESSEIKIGLHAGVPVTEKQSIFADTIKLAERMHFISCAEIVISTEVNDLYQSENSSANLNGNYIYVLKAVDEDFLGRLMEFIEKQSQIAGIKVKDIEQDMGVSKSKLYREMIRLTGKSPNTFLLQFRLQNAVKQLKIRKENVSEIAYDSGFNSPSYFAKCFKVQYGIKPSEFLGSERY